MTPRSSICVAVALALGFAFAWRDAYFMSVFILVCYYGAMSVGWNAAAGFTGLVSLGHAMFIGIGAYSVAYANTAFGMSPFLAAPVGVALAALAAAAIGTLCFRYGIRGQYFAICTLAFSEIAFLLVSSAQPLGRSDGMMMRLLDPPAWHLQFHGKWPYGLIAAGLLVATLAAAHLLLRSRAGYYWRAIRDNEEAARALGVPAFRYKMLAYCFSAVVAATCGAFFAAYTSFVDPRSVLGIELSIQLLVFAIVGGMRSVWGPFAGAALLIVLSEVLRTWAGANLRGIDIVLYAVVLVLVVLRSPQGLAGLIGTWRAPVSGEARLAERSR